jgi:AraC family transcriptional regulator, transcriptional activator of pobA
MDTGGAFWHLSDMADLRTPIPAFALYGESGGFPDLLHVERIADRAQGLNWVIGPHRHLRLHQVLYLAEGGGDLTIEGVPHVLAAPCIVNLPPGTVHGFRFTAGTLGQVVSIPVPDWPEVLGSEAAPAVARAGCATAGADLAQAVARLEAEFRDGRNLRRLKVLAALADLVLQLAALRVFAAAPMGGEDARVTRFRALLDETPSITLRIAECAAGLNMTARHLSRLCQVQTGLSAQALLHGAVLREACRLLAYTRMQVAEVGHRLGFDDPAYFSRFFRRHAGVSPAAYRARVNP